MSHSKEPRNRYSQGKPENPAEALAYLQAQRKAFNLSHGERLETPSAPTGQTDIPATRENVVIQVIVDKYAKKHAALDQRDLNWRKANRNAGVGGIVAVVGCVIGGLMLGGVIAAAPLAGALVLGGSILLGLTMAGVLLKSLFRDKPKLDQELDQARATLSSQWELESGIINSCKAAIDTMKTLDAGSVATALADIGLTGTPDQLDINQMTVKQAQQVVNIPHHIRADERMVEKIDATKRLFRYYLKNKNDQPLKQALERQGVTFKTPTKYGLPVETFPKDPKQLQQVLIYAERLVKYASSSGCVENSLQERWQDAELTPRTKWPSVMDVAAIEQLEQQVTAKVKLDFCFERYQQLLQVSSMSQYSFTRQEVEQHQDKINRLIDHLKRGPLTTKQIQTLFDGLPRDHAATKALKDICERQNSDQALPLANLMHRGSKSMGSDKEQPMQGDLNTLHPERMLAAPPTRVAIAAKDDCATKSGSRVGPDRLSKEVDKAMPGQHDKRGSRLDQLRGGWRQRGCEAQARQSKERGPYSPSRLGPHRP